MRKLILSLALVLAGGSGTDALAQQRKASRDKQSEQPTTPTIGYQRCEGGLFFIEDGGMGPRCQRRDGKICQIRGGTSGQAIMTDCK
jgi:hypothetical protein